MKGVPYDARKNIVLLNFYKKTYQEDKILVYTLKEALEKELKPKNVKVVLQKEYGKGQFTLGAQNQGMGMSCFNPTVAINLTIADKKLKEEEYKSKH